MTNSHGTRYVITLKNAVVVDSSSSVLVELCFLGSVFEKCERMLLVLNLIGFLSELLTKIPFHPYQLFHEKFIRWSVFVPF